MEIPRETSPIPTPTGRILSLDVFRGLTIAGMILVNNSGNGSHVFAPLRHASWEGWTPTDLVFPSFVFIVGVAIPLALARRRDNGGADRTLVVKILWRSAAIFGLGVLLNWFPFQKSFANLRIPGVLQRIALCYLAAALISLRIRTRGQLAIVAGLLFGYWALMELVPVPGHGAGDLSRPGNLAAWVDRGLLPGHLYKPDYDPEGVLSTLPAIATALIGVITGNWLLRARPAGERAAGLLAAGFLLLVAGAIWNWGFPINKALWSSSFVIWSAGLSLLILGTCSWLLEVQEVSAWSRPFVIFGSNPIAAYVGSGLLAGVLNMITMPGGMSEGSGPESLRHLLYTHAFSSWAPPTIASLLWAVAYVLFWLAIMTVFYRKKWFIRL